MKCVIYIATSLDGYIARIDGNLDWLMELENPEGNDFGFSDFIETIDAVVMGKNTFMIVRSFGEWPYKKPVFVLSNSLKKVPDNLIDRLEILNGEPPEIIKTLASRNFSRLYVDGGKVIQQFLQHELIDEMIITKIPILLGSGIPLFTGGIIEQKFRHIQTEVYDDALVKSHYIKVTH